MKTAALALLAISASLPALAGDHADFVAKAKAHLTQSFKDPASAQYRNLFISRRMGGALVLCGEVNGKNSYGGYVGFRGFFATDEAGLQQIADQRSSQSPAAAWPVMCSDEVARAE